MGYDVHITRARRWPDSKSHPIRLDEWLKFVEQDPELRLAGNDHGSYFAFWKMQAGADWGPWLDWTNGEIHTKNPDEALIEKMVEIAKLLGATVQGDDEEVYPGGGAAPRIVRQSAREWIRGRFGKLVWSARTVHRKAEREKRLAELAASFHVGQRVKGFFGSEGVVTAISTDEPPGLGRVTVRFANGKETNFALAASGLTPFPPENGS